MIRDTIQKQSMAALAACGFDAPIFSVSASENPAHGDYATNVALVLAKQKKKNPKMVAEELAAALESGSKGFFESVTVAPPGFINFRLSREALFAELQEIIEKKDAYGNGASKGENIQVEFISANPTGPLTLANARGGFYGDTLARVLERNGYGVEREYYINDAGNQIRTLGLAALASLGEIPTDEKYYRGEHIDAWARENREMVVSNRENPESIGRACAEYFLDTMIRPAVEQKMKIHFDRWTSEHADIRMKKYVEKILGLFEERGLSYESDGARWLKTTDFGDDKDRVLVTSDGFPTYFLVDAAHYMQTKESGFDRKINILGADHHGYVSRIQAVAKILGLKSDVLILQLVRLTENGIEVRMSKRRGTFVTIDELLDEVPADVARFFFLEKSLDTHMDFDLAAAREQSVKNPVYYIQYAHARIASIFRKLGRVDATASLEPMKEPEEFMLIKKLVQFPEIIADTAHDYQVHRITRYAYDTAHLFHTFYEKHRVHIEENPELTRSRAALVHATQIILKRTLDLLGITAPEEM